MNKHDQAIRDVLIPRLQRYSDGDPFIVQEWSIPGGIADVCVLGVDYVAGYEIKSHADSMTRLRFQVPAYEVFDHCHLVTATNHVRAALERLPRWWGVLVIEGERLTTVREGQENPSPRIAELLWQDEARRLVKKLGLWETVLAERRAAAVREGYNYSRPHKGHMTAVLTRHDFRARELVCETIRNRPDWRLADGRSVHGARLRGAI